MGIAEPKSDLMIIVEGLVILPALELTENASDESAKLSKETTRNIMVNDYSLFRFKQTLCTLLTDVFCY